MVMMTFQIRLKKSRKPTQPGIRFDFEKLDSTEGSAFQATIGGRFELLVTLVDEDADLDSMVTHLNKAVTDTAAKLRGKQRRKKRLWVTPEILDLCIQLRDLKKPRGEPEGAEAQDKKAQDKDEDGKKRPGYRVNARKWKHVSERITTKKHTS